MKIAIIGANGFVGSRLVEMFHLNGLAEVRPVVRGVNSLARLARFDLDWKLADARDVAALTEALRGCDAAVHAVVGEPDTIEGAAAALMPAAHAAGVKRVIYLSTASVHGQNPAPGTDESSPLSDRQPVPYNNAKIRAERSLLAARQSGPCELVMLRPSIVFGPRDRWVSTLAGELREDRAWLIDEGRGLCNTIYVDNLVQAVHCALRAPAARSDGQAFLVGDAENVTWARFYREIAGGIGVDVASIHQIATPEFPAPGLRRKLGRLKSTGTVRAVLPLFSPRLKQAVKGTIKGWNQADAPSGWTLPATTAPAPTVEMVELQRCAWRLPFSRAVAALGYRPAVSFGEGVRRTVAWVREFQEGAGIHAG